MKVKTKTDFLDYYDHWFDGNDAPLTFYRMSTGGMSRPEMFDFFEKYGFRTPEHGKVKDIWGIIDRSLWDIVVYTDDRAHRSEGKVLMNYEQSMRQAKDCFASRYIPVQKNGRSVSFRYLSVGGSYFWLKYSSTDSWRSNYGEVEIEVIPESEYGKYPCIGIGLPLYAIDFVVSGGISYAIDFNIAPQIKGTGVEHLLPANHVVDTIKLYLETQYSECNL